MSLVPQIGAAVKREQDLQLARAAAAGDANARKRVVRELLDRVRATVGYLAVADRDADDLVQVSLIEILRSIGSFRGESSLRTWADRIAVRTTLRLIRRRRRAEQIVELADPPRGTSAIDSADELRRRELQRSLCRVLGKLRPKIRAVVVLHYGQGHSVVEIAGILDLPVETVRDRLRRGRQRFRKSVMGDPCLAEWAEGQCR